MNNDDMKILKTKFSFATGIVVIMQIIENIWYLFTAFPTWGKGIQFVVCIILMAVVLTRFLDSIMSKKEMGKFGDFLMIVSIMIYMFEKALEIILDCGDELSVSDKASIIILGLVVIIGAVSVLLNKKDDIDKVVE